MKVTLVNKNEVEEMLAKAGWMGSVSAGIEQEDLDFDRLEKIGKKCIDSGHLSVTRSCLPIFRIKGISRACSHQFVREEVGVYKVQESQRYVKMTDPEFVIPDSIQDNPEARARFVALMQSAWETYHELCGMGIPMEDARFVIPNACYTKIHVAVSIEALIRIAGKRLCNRAQWEIREVVRRMVEEVVEVLPYLKDKLVCKCESVGYCTEEKCCGKKPTKKAFMETYERGKYFERSYSKGDTGSEES